MCDYVCDYVCADLIIIISVVSFQVGYDDDDDGCGRGFGLSLRAIIQVSKFQMSCSCDENSIGLKFRAAALEE